MSEDHVQLDPGVPSGSSDNDMSSGAVTGEPSPQPAMPNWREFVDGLNKLNDNLGSKLDGINSVVTETTRPPPPAPPNYDEMNNTELVAHISGSLQSVIAEAVQAAVRPLIQQVSQTQQDVVQTRSSIEVERMKAQHRDLVDWKDEMIGLAKQHPTMGLQDLYDLSKARNPQKARSLDLKYNPPPPKPRPYGSLTPSGNGKPGEPVLKGEEATRAAYREVSEKYPGILPILQDL